MHHRDVHSEKIFLLLIHDADGFARKNWIAMLTFHEKFVVVKVTGESFLASKYKSWIECVFDVSKSIVSS
jgi:hypothetical protein